MVRADCDRRFRGNPLPPRASMYPIPIDSQGQRRSAFAPLRSDCSKKQTRPPDAPVLKFCTIRSNCEFSREIRRDPHEFTSWVNQIPG
jgi:hypothetical protein